MFPLIEEAERIVEAALLTKLNNNNVFWKFLESLDQKGVFTPIEITQLIGFVFKEQLDLVSLEEDKIFLPQTFFSWVLAEPRQKITPLRRVNHDFLFI